MILRKLFHWPSSIIYVLEDICAKTSKGRLRACYAVGWGEICPMKGASKKGGGGAAVVLMVSSDCLAFCSLSCRSS